MLLIVIMPFSTLKGKKKSQLDK